MATRIIVVGRREFIEVFEALGVKVIEVGGHSCLKDVLERLVQEDQPHVLFIDKELASKAKKYLQEFKTKNPLPLIIPY